MRGGMTMGRPGLHGVPVTIGRSTGDPSMRRTLLATALLACALPLFARSVALITTAERSGFKQTGRYDEVIALCDAFQEV